MNETIVTNDDVYDGYLARVQERFLGAVAGGEPLFATREMDRLFDLYIESFGEADRQHHTCHACRRFLGRYGGLVTIDMEGRVRSALWHEGDAPEYYRAAIGTMREHVEKADVTGAFYAKEDIWGDPVTGVWHHYAVRPPRSVVHTNLAVTPFQRMAQHKEDYQNVWRALLDFNIEHLRTAVTLLTSESLYRSERVLGAAQWLLDLQERVQAANSRRRGNIVERAVALAPSGYCHPRSGMIGTLLEDIAAGMSFEQVKRRFADKMNPTQYQRAQVAPAAGAIQQAEKLFEQLGLAPALARRYATLSDLPADAFVWTPVVAKELPKQVSGVFSHIQPQSQNVPAVAAPVVPSVAITWEKFQRTVLPGAQTIEVQVPSTADRFMALVTAADQDAPPILQWDREDARNPVSWYYASGIDAEMRRRLVQAGGRFENIDIRCSLMWNNRNDLDLHAFTPSGHHIFYGDKHPYGQEGWLDVDMNVRGETETPVENIRWERAPLGQYHFYVNLYATHYGPVMTPFTVEVEVNGEVFTAIGMTYTANPGNLRSYMVSVAEFTYQREQSLGSIGGSAQRAATSPNAWGVTPGSFVPVKGIVTSPNLWGEKPQEHHGRHAFFLLEGCKDTQQGVGRGFFTEMVRADLRPVRSVLEAYNAGAVIADAPEDAACGIGMSNTSTGDTVVRVTGTTGRTIYKIDRWD